MVDIDVVLCGFVDVDFEVGDVVFCFCGDDEVICGEDLEFLAFVV